MNDNYQDLMDEKEYERRFLMHQRFRKVLLVINLLFAFYLVVQLVKVCYKQINKDDRNSYTAKIDNLMNDGENPYKLRSIQIRDYIIYGDNLSLYYYDYDVSSENDYFVKEDSTFTLKNLDTNNEYVFETSKYIDENIDLSSLEEGTYIMFYQEEVGQDDYIVTYEAYNTSKKYTLYSLPYKSSDKFVNKKIVIGAIYSNSFPLMTIKVEEEKLLSNKSYDIAINYKENDDSEVVAKHLKEKFKNINLNVYLNKSSSSDSSKASFYKYIYENNINYAIDLVEDNSVENMEYIHSVKTKGYLTSVDEITMVVEENGLNLDENLFVRELGGRATGTGLCRGEDSSSISCSMGDRKNEMGVSAITIKVNGDNEEQLKYYGDIIFNGFINKYVE